MLLRVYCLALRLSYFYPLHSMSEKRSSSLLIAPFQKVLGISTVRVDTLVHIKIARYRSQTNKQNKIHTVKYELVIRVDIQAKNILAGPVAVEQGIMVLN